MSNTNPPAFPRPFSVDDVDPDITYPAHAGLSMRDYFAAKAMVGIIAHPEGPAGLWDKCALQAYEVADAMLKAREL